MMQPNLKTFFILFLN